MRRVRAIWLCLALISSLLVSCGNTKQTLIDEACTQVRNARAIEGFLTPKYQKLRSEYWKSAADSFRKLAAEDSGFTKYASRSNEAISKQITNYTEFYEMINFCGAK